MSSDQNPADIGSRGSQNEELLELWLKGENRLPNPELWPAPAETEPSEESEAEAKLVKDVFAVAIEPNDGLHQLLQKHEFWPTIRITAWVARFIRNCKSGKANRLLGLLTTAETIKQVKGWLLRVQQSYVNTEQFREDRLRLNLQKNEEGLHECRGRIQGSYLSTYHLMPC